MNRGAKSPERLLLVKPSHYKIVQFRPRKNNDDDKNADGSD